MIAIHTGQLIDGIHTQSLRDATILIEDDRILEIGASGEVSVPPEAQAIDARHLTVMPGLVDAHVHVHSAGGPVENYAWPEVMGLQGFHALRALANVRRDLNMGWTTLRNMASPAYVDIALRDAIEQGLVEGPRLRVPGQGLSITGGHMDHGPWVPEVNILTRTGIADSPDAFRRAAREQFKRGADFIKINACVGYHRDLSRPWQQEMTYDEMAAVCEEAHWRGKRVAAHTAGGQGITDAIRAGVDSLEHAHWLSDEQIEMMAARGTILVPTLLVNDRSVELSRQGERDKSDLAMAWLEKVYVEKWDTLARAKAGGVKIACGTDAGFVINHGENACELELLVKGGLSPMEAIMAATRTSAECLGLAKEAGTLEPGKWADVVLVDGDPLADIRLLQDEAKIVAVFKAGKQVK